jgi:hypothetical protein
MNVILKEGEEKEEPVELEAWMLQPQNWLHQ